MRAESLGPLSPRMLPMTRVERPEQRVVIEPPALLGDVRAERHGALRASGEIDGTELREAAPERGVLQAAHFGVLDVRGHARSVEPRPQGRFERVLTTNRREILDIVHGD